jgi:Uma2 family endonuclease
METLNHANPFRNSMKTIDESSLIYEQIDGNPVYYKGYQNALYNIVTIEEIMGSSVSQSMVISILLNFLYKSLDEEKYVILTNELGLHLEKGTNLAADIAIVDVASPQLRVDNLQYLSKAPEVVIEVDLKADMSSFASPIDYYLQKTRKLLDFGVRKVIWVNTVSKTIMVDNELKPLPWDTSVEILPDIFLSVGNLVEDFTHKRKKG